MLNSSRGTLTDIEGRFGKTWGRPGVNGISWGNCQERLKNSGKLTLKIIYISNKILLKLRHTCLINNYLDLILCRDVCNPPQNTKLVFLASPNAAIENFVSRVFHLQNPQLKTRIKSI